MSMSVKVTMEDIKSLSNAVLSKAGYSVVHARAITEMLYNPSRKHTNNDMLSPVDYVAKQTKLNEAGVWETRGTSNRPMITSSTLPSACVEITCRALLLRRCFSGISCDWIA